MLQKKTARNVGLARALSKLGYCSRSQAAASIRAGRVRLNGTVRRDPETPVNLGQDRVTVDDAAIEPKKQIYLMMNKPRGLITTASDDKGRQTVYAVLNNAVQNHTILNQESPPWVAPVGRLDKASEGLLLLTNDSEWGARVTAPETHLPKTYHVQVATVAHEKLAAAMVHGVRNNGVRNNGLTNNGEILRAREARLIRCGEKNCWLEIVLDEGKNRHIRHMLETLDVEMLRLVRVAIGPLQLGKLAKGEYRKLTPEEKKMLDRAMRARIE